MKINTFKKSLALALSLGAIVGTSSNINASTWRANSTSVIQQAMSSDREKYKENIYDIRWGDYLYGISQATNINVDVLAQVNNISNKNLIYTGNKLYYGASNTLVTKDNNGNLQAYNYNGGVVQQTKPSDLSNSDQRNLVKNHPSLQGQSGIKDLDTVNKDLLDENSKKLKDLEDKIAKYKKEKQQLEEFNKESQKKIEVNKEYIKRSNNETKKESLESQIEMLEDKIKKNDEKILELKKALNKSNEEIKNKKSETKDVLNDLNSSLTKSEMDKLIKSMAKSDYEFKKIVDDMNDNYQKSLSYKEKLSKTEKELADKIEQIKELNKRLETLKEENDKYKEKAKSDQAEENKKEVERLNSITSKNEKEISDLKQKINNLEKELEDIAIKKDKDVKKSPYETWKELQKKNNPEIKDEDLTKDDFIEFLLSNSEDNLFHGAEEADN